MATNLRLVPATAGKRLGAAVIDWLPPLAVLVVSFAVGFAGVTRTRSGGFIIYDTASLVLFGGIGLGLAVVYLFVVMGLEARTGKTPGNLLMGIRSADNDGYVAVQVTVGDKRASLGSPETISSRRLRSCWGKRRLTSMPGPRPPLGRCSRTSTRSAV